jgi:flagellar hook-associated protein 2
MSSGIRASGMVSGLDTDTLVQAMVSTQVSKKEKLQKAQTKLQWKQDAFKSLNTKVYGLYSKVGNLRFSGAYNMKKTTVSDTTKAQVTASNTAVNGIQTLQIKQLATSGYLTGGELKKGTTGKTMLKELGYDGADTSISVTIGSSKKDIDVSGSTTVDDLVSKLKDAGLNASFDDKNGRIFVSAKETGKENDFSLTGADMTGLKALNAAGLSVMSKSDIENYNKMASYAKNDDTGSYSESKTSILQTLKNLQNAYEGNTKLALEEKDLNAKIAYSDAKDAVNKYLDGDDTNANKKAEREQLANLLKQSSSKYTYVNDQTGEVKEIYDVKDAAGWTAYDKKVNELAKSTGLITETTGDDGETKEDSTKLEALSNNIKTVIAVDDNAIYTDDDKKAYYLSEDKRAEAKTRLEEIPKEKEANDAVIADEDNGYWDIKDYSGKTEDDLAAIADKYAKQVTNARDMVEKLANGSKDIPISVGASRVDAQDAKITLNKADFTSSSNVFNINGLTIKATAKTADGETLSINTDTDTQGIYDKIKDFLTDYNSIINELTSLYNADSAKGYEPLTDDEKESMSDKEVEKWETKIKDAILRNDSTVGGVMNAMTTAMMKSYTINGKSYSLSSFGIHTQGYLNAAKNEQYAYHIDGDEDDTITSGNTDKLMDMINNNPEDLEAFMKQLTSGLYSALDSKMKSTTLSSAYTIYNDKQMTREYSNYTKEIKEWETKISDLEDRYYKQFSTMETQLAKMQSATSSITSMLG